MNQDSPDPALGYVLDRVRQSAAELLAGLAHPPKTLSLRAGEVAITIDWPETAQLADLTPAAATGDGDGRRTLTAQSVGVFYRAPEPGTEPFVAEGDRIEPGQQLAIIEAMKLMIPVRAEDGGRIVEVLKKDGEPVEYGEALFAIEAG
jgi:acetyl-CoA carboxylase biotin carboxyl carrier protein